MTLWKFNCMEDRYPGMWPRWFRQQCVGVGWCSEDGFTLDGESIAPGWSRARQALKEIQIGDQVIVTLKNHRVGRIGEVTGKAIEDKDWDPLVPQSVTLPNGEMGRRIFLRWDMTCGPDSRDQVILLPEHARFSGGELRPTISKITSVSVVTLKSEMNDPTNWVELWAHFDYERSLSGYVAAYPHRLEDGLLQHPDLKVRERVFNDQSRLDVILLDRNGTPVIVECKQGAPTVSHIAQLRHYMSKLEAETGRIPRGILLHGGSRKLAQDVATKANQDPRVELVSYGVNIEFNSSS